MAEPIIVEVVSPEKVLYSGEADDGHHAHARAAARSPSRPGTPRSSPRWCENHTRVFQIDGKVQDIAVHRGFVEVSGTPTKVSILSDTAELAEDIDVERAKAALEHHLHVLRDEKMENEIAQAICGRDRAIARLKATGTGFTA